MDKQSPDKFSSLLANIQLLRLSVAVDADIAAILQDLHIRVYALSEDNKRLVAVTRDQGRKIKALEDRLVDLRGLSAK